jgi:prepilin-type N-terminal cleavage/methylation domain-containing protein
MKRGFTIVELLIVIVVIAILAAISIVAYNGIQQRARDAQRKQVVADLVKSIHLYAADRGNDITVGGGANDGTGWVNSGSPTITASLQSAGVVNNASGLRDPKCLAVEVPGCSGLIKFRCNGGSSFAIAAKLESGGTPGLPSQLSSCANSGWWGQFGMNYYVMGQV